MSRARSVQSVHLGLTDIRDDILILAGPSYRAVLEVEPINYSFKSEEEQWALVSAYAVFLNSLSYPLQLLVRAVPIDVSRYLADLEARASRLESPRLRELAADHLVYVRQEARRQELIDRRFYVVIPAEESGDRRTMSGGQAEVLREDSAGRRLAQRSAEVAVGLGRCHLATHRLGTEDLLRLHYGCWCPERSCIQTLRLRVAEHTVPVVRAEHPRSAPGTPTGAANGSQVLAGHRRTL